MATHSRGSGGAYSEFKSALPEIIAELPAITMEVAVKTAQKIADKGEANAKDQGLGTKAHTDRPEHDPEHPFHLEPKHLSNGGGVYADWWWYFEEFGTVRQAATPFLIPAMEESYGEIYPEARAAFSKLAAVE